MKEINKTGDELIYFSNADKALQSWTGGGFYDLLWSIKVWKWMFCIWKLPKHIEINKDDKNN